MWLATIYWHRLSIAFNYMMKLPCKDNIFSLVLFYAFCSVQLTKHKIAEVYFLWMVGGWAEKVDLYIMFKI